MEILECTRDRLHLALPVSRWAFPFALLPWAMPVLGWYLWLGWGAFLVCAATALLLSHEILPTRYEITVDRSAGAVVKHSGFLKQTKTIFVPADAILDVRVETITSRLSAQRHSYKMHVVTRQGAAVTVNPEAVRRDLNQPARILRGFLGIVEDEEDVDVEKVEEDKKTQ